MAIVVSGELNDDVAILELERRESVGHDGEAVGVEVCAEVRCQDGKKRVCKK